jgi:hypothetical protein
MTLFTPKRGYEPHLDIRFAANSVPGWAEQIVKGSPPVGNGWCWQVVMPRRGGKTWLARAIETARRFGTAGMTGPTVRVDLRTEDAAQDAGLRCLLDGVTPPHPQGGVVLIDEPTLDPDTGVYTATFAKGLRLIRNAGAVPVVFATPREHAMLREDLRPDGDKSELFPPPLEAPEIARMCARAPGWASEVVHLAQEAGNDAWLRTPFLLELLLSIAEEYPALRSDLPRLVRAALDTAARDHQYVDQVLDKGVAENQRAELRVGRWRAVGIDLPQQLRYPLDKIAIPLDPVVADHQPDVLRIHHLSDLHHGGRLRSTVDAKDRTKAGKDIEKLAGAGTPLDRYLAHLAQLKERGKSPHLVVITGDLVNRPTDEAGKAAREWLEQLPEHLAPHPDLCRDDPRIILVGGNHDVSWERCMDTDRRARHQWFAETFQDYPHPDLHKEAGDDRRLFVEFPGAGLRIALFGSAESGGEVRYNASQQRLVKRFHDYLDVGDHANAQKLMERLERIDPGVVSRVMLDRLAPNDGYLTLAALHHPLSPVPSVEIAPYSGIINGGQVKQVLAAARTALVLHGHTHLNFLAAERLLTQRPAWTMRIAGAATLAAGSADEQNGYNEVFIAREGRTHALLVRPVRLSGGQWVPQRELAVAFRPGAPYECSLGELTADPPVATPQVH